MCVRAVITLCVCVRFTVRMSLYILPPWTCFWRVCVCMMIPWLYGAAEHFPFLMASHYITAKWRKWRRGNWDLFQRCSVCVFWTAGLFSKHVRVHVGQAEVNSRLLWPAAGLSVFRLVVFSKKKKKEDEDIQWDGGNNTSRSARSTGCCTESLCQFQLNWTWNHSQKENDLIDLGFQ